MFSPKPFPRIKQVRSYVVDGVGSGGDYHNVARGHWLVDNPIANPMSRWEQYRKSRTSWGINVLGSFCIEIVSTDGTTGFATGFGGPPACWIAHKHFERFLIGADPRQTNLLWDQMFRASMFYGRKGLAIAVISVIDLALWDLVGKIRGEPVYQMIGGATRDRIDFYCTTPDPVAAKRMGFWGAKVPLPYGPDEGHAGLLKNYEFLKKHREAIGPDFPLMVDCYMALNVPYTIELAKKCLDLNINWWEEVLHPDDFDGFRQLKEAHPQLKFTTGEHEYTRYGFRKLIEGRCLDIIQPDVMWVGGLTELLKVTAQAAAYDIPVVPHASGPYSYHYVISQSNTPFQEYLANSPDGQTVLPVFGDLFIDEVIPVNGILELSRLDKPGFGLVVNPAARLLDARRMLEPGVAGVGMTIELDAPGPLPSSTSAGFAPARWETTRSASGSTSNSAVVVAPKNGEQKDPVAESSQKEE
ncbi:mandelate racemase muconate lactonizing enzyme family protein [Tirmania nivea]|nr:mandelate racemase muconate lactonizing enzyme family protein [Tirmania nivea]